MKLVLVAALFLAGCGGVDNHTVSLLWQAVTEPGENFHVYRDSKVVATVPTKSYVDKPGKGTHVYTVTGVANGLESKHSNTFTAKVP